MRIKQILVFLVAGLATALFATAPAVTWYVDAAAAAGGSGLSASSAFPSIAEAVAAAASGDTVRIAAGVYKENVVLEGKSLTIVGAGRDATIIDAEESGRPLYLKGVAVTGTRVKSLCLANGRADVGAGLYVDTADMDIGFLDGKITDCVSTGNGAAANGSAWIVRTLVGRCWSTGSDKAVFTGVKGLFSCVVIGCGRKVTTNWNDADMSVIVDSYASGEQIKVVNCTFSSNEGRLARWNSSQAANLVIRNCALFGVHKAWVRQAMNVQYSFTARGGVLQNNCHNIGDDYSHGNTHYQVVAPFSDWRPVAGADIIDRGSNAFVTDLVPEEYRGTDYYGNARIQNSTVDMGAAEGGVTLASGIVFFPVQLDSAEVTYATNLWVNGYRVIEPDNKMTSGATATFANGIHFASTEANRTATMEFRYFDNRSLAIWGFTGTVADKTTVWHPNQKGQFTFVLPAAGAVVTNSLVKAASIKWVSPDGNDAAAGTEAAPYRTLQKAHDSSSNYGVIFAKRGTYAEGSHVGVADSDNVCTTLNRLYIDKKVYLTSVDGAENTVIKGERATGTGTYDGCGSGAMRCVQTWNGVLSCICGFTLTGGATDANPIAQQLTKTGDSTNRGNFGGSAAQGHTWNGDKDTLQLVDCIISNNVSYFGTVYSVLVKNCVLADNRIVSQDSSGTNVTQASGAMGTRAKFFGCLAYANDASRSWIGGGGYTGLYDSTLAGPGAVGSTTVTRNTAFLDMTSLPSGRVPDITLNRNDFADSDNGDYRPVPGSRLLSGASSNTLTQDYVRFGTTSMDGLDYTPESGLGLVVGAYRGAAKYPATARDLYVNAAKADDSGDGLTPATAKKTLAAVMALAHRGDVVHAAAGTYDEGEMTNRVSFINSGQTTPVNLIGSRVVVPYGVSLVSEEGPDVTFIKGRLGSGSYSMGDNALRGVYMEEDTLLEGFTVKTCATRYSGGENEYNCGACVVAPYANVARPAIIRNCYLTDGHARSGAAAFGGVFEGCRIDRCILSSDGLFYRAKLDNCLVVSKNRASGHMSAFRNCYGVRNSTVYVDDASGDADFDQASGSFGFENSIIYYEKFTKATTIKNAKNCIIKSVANLTIDSSCSGTIAAGTLSSLLDTTTYHPVAGSAAIDAGDMTLFNANPSALDCGGGQRVYSGIVDIGAYEYDLRGAMATAIAKKDVSVAAADGGATVGTGVLLTNGVLEAVWQKKSSSARCEVGFQVTGNGVLVVTDETGVIGRYAAGGAESFMWGPPGTGAKHIYFTYQPAASDPSGAGAAILRMDVVSGFAIMIR